MNRHDVRYMFEHKLLPQWFFEEKEKFIAYLLKDKSALFGMIDKAFQKAAIDNPYSKDQFRAVGGKLTDQVLVVVLGFPKPEEEPLCYCSYLFFDQKFEKQHISA